MSIPDGLLGRGSHDAVLLAPLAGNFELLGRNIALIVVWDNGFRRGRGGFDDDETRGDTASLLPTPCLPMALDRGEGALAGDFTGPGDSVDDLE